MNRLYAVESSPGLSGAVADHRLALRADRIEGFARSLAARAQRRRRPDSIRSTTCPRLG